MNRLYWAYYDWMARRPLWLQSLLVGALWGLAMWAVFTGLTGRSRFLSWMCFGAVFAILVYIIARFKQGPSGSLFPRDRRDASR
jgi:polyferredoxin